VEAIFHFTDRMTRSNAFLEEKKILVCGSGLLIVNTGFFTMQWKFPVEYPFLKPELNTKYNTDPTIYRCQIFCSTTTLLMPEI
jgi:hypothetical protein